MEEKTIELLKDITEKRKALIFCRCKKINCLKSYCDCFRKNLKCNENCLCNHCDNKPTNKEEEKISQEKNQNFKNKLKIQICNCSKSNCDNKYCLCKSRNQKCSYRCHCNGCKNSVEYTRNNIMKQNKKIRKLKIKTLEKKSIYNLKTLLLEKLNFLCTLKRKDSN